MKQSPWVLVGTVFLVMIGLSLVAPILPLYAREFGVSRTAAGGLISSFAFARLIFDFAGGPIVDRVGSRRIMVGGALVLSVASVVAALAPSYQILLFSRFVEGAGSAAFATAAMHYLIVTTDVTQRGRVMARFQMGLVGGITIGPVVGGYASELGDFTTPFWIYAGIGLIIAAVAWRYIDDVPPTGATIREVYGAAGRLAKRPAFLALMFVTFGLFFMRGGINITLIPLFGSEELGLGADQIGTVLAGAAFMNLLIVNPGGWVVDNVGRKPVLLVGLVVTAPIIDVYGWTTSYLTLLLVGLAYGLVTSLAALPPPTMAGDLAPPGATGAAVGLYRVAGDLGLVIGPLALGAIVEDGSFRLGFAVAAAVLIVGAVLTAVFIPETRHGDQASDAVLTGDDRNVDPPV
ncbi:MAG: MFS transporter [Acidimicrobiia bacterium]|nr:MFS transporter [Acidimicrobiia bacterium]